MKYQADLDKAEEFKGELNVFFKRVIKKKPKNLDEVFQKHHDKVFQKVDCMACANCCKTTSPIFRDIDIKRIAKKIRMNVGEFERTYLRRDEDDFMVLQTAPCAFLADDNSCSIYDVRPLACSEYPHTNRKKVVQVMELTEKNTRICPAVSQIVFKVKEDLG